MPKPWWKLVPFAADPSRLPRFPTEVWERILDECDAADWVYYPVRTKTFAACCLTCRAWLPRSRYHLFKYVIVQSKEQAKQVSKLLHSIPALRTRVEKLHVYGSKDGKRDASWFGLVGFHLGPKLKALTTIHVERVDLSLVKIEAYTFWGAFNRAWRTDAPRRLYLEGCTVTHLNQLIRLALVTKADSLTFVPDPPYEEPKPTPPAPLLSSGISLPLSTLDILAYTSDLILPIPWHTLAKQCPSLSTVVIACRDDKLDLSSPDGRQLLVSIFYMFRRMQQHNNANHVTLWTFSLPKIEMKTRLRGKPANAGVTPPAARPCLYRELVLVDQWSFRFSMEPFAKLLTLIEDAMMLANYTNRRFHHIKTLNSLQSDSFQSLDSVLSRLFIATHDVHVTIEEEHQRRKECVVPWAKERFPMLTAVVPNAFCDPEAGKPCDSHPTQANGVERGREVEGGVVAEVAEVGQGVEIGAGLAVEKRKVTEGLEDKDEEAWGKVKDAITRVGSVTR